MLERTGKKTFTIMVSRSPYDSRNSESALKFCYAALEAGHAINQVFFYQSGVHCASSFITPPSDELNMHNEWVTLNTKYNIKLNVCNTAASRRGIVNEDTSLSTNINVNKPFIMTGLSDYFSALNSGEVNVQF